ncbi:DMT family transporter [Leucothrix arctica]|uniref:QacE family quaternary ammonium compound efflux SMR transporter n=1 Tax=Leucothrix arctica TaxID=1481894 RepID=A0A317CAD6_9GAMM|nr:SMR family transporter [Leucothrix arctica]PWQ95337.1 QacE family quaternary ammonium compound efflux SMR transporter [Leucothrix arctica]
MFKTYAILVVAILAEIIAANALKSSNQFTRVWPTVLSLSCYCVSLFLLTLVLKKMSLGITYAIWSGMGIVFVAIIGVLWHKEALDMPAVLGMLLIIAGVMVINLFSKVVGS